MLIGRFLMVFENQTRSEFKSGEDDILAIRIKGRGV